MLSGGDFKRRIRPGGQMTVRAIPLMLSTGRAPQKRLSLLFQKLSPITKTVPEGTLYGLPARAYPDV